MRAGKSKGQGKGRVGGAAPTGDDAPALPHALYLVSTPIGNLEDITLRALRVLRGARLVAAEDTRHTAKLLAHYGIAVPTLSYHEHNRAARLDRLLATLAEGPVALVSDAGTPGLSDPGYELVRAAQGRGIAVVPVPGASALLAAVVASGLVPGPFTFLGFPPPAAGER
ncbi:MAG: rRNA small subunit methyltransferase 1, partial [Chloroflexota bacterium]|nr:rRNA small subunit methyltransferase 1 [Chloroflexota bacterium]